MSVSRNSPARSRPTSKMGRLEKAVPFCPGGPPLRSGIPPLSGSARLLASSARPAAERQWPHLRPVRESRCSSTRSLDLSRVPARPSKGGQNFHVLRAVRRGASCPYSTPDPEGFHNPPPPVENSPENPEQNRLHGLKAAVKPVFFHRTYPFAGCGRTRTPARQCRHTPGRSMRIRKITNRRAGL